MSHVAFQPHEHEGHLVFTEHGDSPYWGWSQVMQELTWNAEEIEVDVDGERWLVDVYFSESGLMARDTDPVDGRLNEYRIKARAVGEDDRRKFTVKMSPRWVGLESQSGDVVETPFENDVVNVDGDKIKMADAGIDIEYQTSNLATPTRPAELVPAMFQAVADHAGAFWEFDYLQTPHRISSVKALEGYVRHREETQDKLVADDGVMMRLFHLVGHKTGTSVKYEANNQEKVGHRHRVKVEDGISDVLPGQQYGKQFKSYYPKEIVGGGPLSEPKFGVLVVNGWQDETVHFQDLDDVWQEIEEAGVNVLSWAGVQTGSSGPFVGDDHFEPTVSDVEIQRIDDPLPQIEASQQAHVLRLFTDASNADQEILSQLATDGGEAHHAALEADTGYSSSTLYRMLQRLPQLVESDNGAISFASEKLYQDVKDILERSEKQIQRAGQQVANMLGIEADVLDSKRGALRRFAQKYAADLDQKGARLEVKLNAIISELQSVHEDLPKIWTVVDELRRALRGTRYRADTRQIWVNFEKPNGEQVRRPIDSPRLSHR